MRGKLVVLGMLLAAGVLFVYSLWFTNITTTVDERFNQRRPDLAADASGALILRVRHGDFERITLEKDTLDNREGPRHGSAIYENVEGRTLRLEVESVAEVPTINAIFEDFGQRAGGSDAAGTSIVLHSDARVPFGYGVYSAPTYIYYEFTWINGDWIIRVSTREAGSESLLRFANGLAF